VVNKQVYFLIKKRLSADSDQEPPLFPWETVIEEYTEDGVEQPPNGHDKSEPPPAGQPPADE
jgi:hypothetical protein